MKKWNHWKTWAFVAFVVIVAILLFARPASSQPMMWYNKSASTIGWDHPTIGLWNPPAIEDYYHDDEWHCHVHGANGTGWYRVLAYNTEIVNMGDAPAIIDTTGKGYYFDECHYHVHWDLITTTLYSVTGGVSAGGEKMGYDWVDASKFNPDVYQLAEMQELGLTWTDPNVPPYNPAPNEFVITQGFTDPYAKDFPNNFVIIGYYTSYDSVAGKPTGFIGIADGIYRWHSEANFEGLGFTDKTWPNWWEEWIEIQGMNLTVGVTPPVAPVAPTNVMVNYDFKVGTGPQLVWSGGGPEYELATRLTKGSNNVDLTPITLSGTSYVDDRLQAVIAGHSALSGNGAVFCTYRLRSKTSGGVSDWVDVKKFKL